MSKPLCIDLFSGGGGMSIGFNNAGYEVIGYEYKEDIVTNANNNGLDTRNADIFAANFVDALPSDIYIIVGGPPCQPFSQGNKRRLGEGDIRNGIDIFLNIVKRKQPQYFLMEEAPTLTWNQHRDYFEKVLHKIHKIGYKCIYKVCDMSYFNVPQKRKRTIIIGRRGSESIPETLLFNETQEASKIRDVLTRKEIESVKILSEGKIQNNNFNNSFKNEDNEISRYPKHVVQRIYEKYEYRDNMKYPLKLSRVLNINKPSFTLSITSLKCSTVAAMPNNGARFAFRVEGERYKLLDELNNKEKESFQDDVVQRTLTVHEMRRIQTFPDTYLFTNRRMAEIIIGNSVPPVFAYIIAKRLLNVEPMVQKVEDVLDNKIKF